MDQQYQVAKKILTSHEKVLDEGAALVLKEENIEGDRLKELLETEKAG
jgi:ATP-dependent Zn protease